MRTLTGMLRIDNLSKCYGDHLIFQRLTHTFSPGCVALCEQDSTGKPSLLDIIAGLIAPDAGNIWIDGHSLAQTPLQAKAHIAYVPDNSMAFPMQTGRELLEQTTSEKNVTLDDGVLELAYKLGLEPRTSALNRCRRVRAARSS